MFKRLLCSVMVFFFLASSVIGPNVARAQALMLPAPGTMVGTSPAFMPVMIKGLKVHPENPLLFDFILDGGDVGAGLVPALDKGRPQGSPLQREAQKLIKYFLAALTIPEKDLWVNLSPYEKDRMVADDLGKTEMGRDMLAQDYILKQLTASMIYPEKDLGKEFWSRVYTKAQEQFGTTDIPVDTFNKVWIVADQAKVLETDNAGYVVAGHLKVMLDTDYTAEQVNLSATRGHSAPLQDNLRGSVSPSTLSAELASDTKATQGADRLPSAKTQELTKQIIREIILPEIEKEVNQGKNFATLRQMFYSMILASWYKKALKDALLNQVYSNQGKTSGVLSDDPKVGEKIYVQYLEAYKKGVFNYISEGVGAGLPRPISDVNKGEETSPVHAAETVFPRQYFSGGLNVFQNFPDGVAVTRDKAQAKGMFADNAQIINVQARINKAPAVSDAAMISELTTYQQLLKTKLKEVRQGIKNGKHRNYPYIWGWANDTLVKSISSTRNFLKSLKNEGVREKDISKYKETISWLIVHKNVEQYYNPPSMVDIQDATEAILKMISNQRFKVSDAAMISELTTYQQLLKTKLKEVRQGIKNGKHRNYPYIWGWANDTLVKSISSTRNFLKSLKNEGVREKDISKYKETISW
ncbi:MAG: hypothetical protein V2A70_02595, partial [Candidatus Omnitrophota bacterium]